MKSLLVLLGLFGAVLAVQEEYGIGQRKYKISDKVFLERQRDILRLFKHIHQLSYYEDHLEIAGNYSIEGNIEAYANSSVAEKFVELYKDGLLPRGAIFTIFNRKHLEEAVSLFKLFYYARDFDALYKTAVWARNHVNGGLFVYSLSTALAHRPDTYTFILPPIYEIYPFFFYDGNVIHSLQEHKQNHSNPKQPLPKEPLSYYLDDIGLNAFYHYCNVYYPFWMDGEEFNLKNDRRGEQYYYLYQQLLARYYLERLSNDLGEIDFFDEQFAEFYYTDLRYANGLAFPNREDRLQRCNGSFTVKRLHSYASYSRMEDFERRLRDSIDRGYIFGNDGKSIDLYGTSDQTNLLGNLVESNPDSLNPRYYGPWQIHARHLVSCYGRCECAERPAAIEHFETALRDPAFYALYNRIVRYFLQYKQYLPPYTPDELNFPGVEIGELHFDPLVTYFNSFDLDLSNALNVTSAEFPRWFKHKVSQQRLNHKPFTYRITVTSDKSNEAVVRIYLGPKHDEHGRVIEIDDNRVNFVEVDTFRYKLEPGKNVIERNSRQTYWYVPDRTSYEQLYQKVVRSINGSEEFQLDSSEAFYGFPTRLLLPKGKREGQTFQVYVIINPYRAPQRPEVKQNYYFHHVGTGMNYVDDYAFGFPFDRVIKSYSRFDVPNSRFLDVVITHKTPEEVNTP